MIHAIVRVIAFVVMRLFAPTSVIGKENIKSGNVIYVCNHQSMVDAFINFTYLPSKTYYMAKKQLFKNKFFTYMLKHTKVFPIDRDKVDLSSIKFACKILSENNNLCIFPQGTRKDVPHIELADMHAGIGMMGMKYNSRVIPMMYVRKPGFFKKNTLIIGSEIDLSEFNGLKPNSQTMNDYAQKVGTEMNKLLEEYVK